MRTPSTQVTAGSSELALRDQLSNLRGLRALTMLMTEHGNEDDIVYLATTAVPSLGRCRINGVHLDGGGWRATAGSCTQPAVRADASVQLTRLDEVGGALVLPGEGWGWAFPLRSFDGPIGHLVVAADEEPSAADLLLLRTLAQQTGSALANARLHTRERAAVANLRTTNATLAETVEALQRTTAIHDRFTQVAVAGGGQQGIARALHELSGFPAAVEDRDGNLLAWAGPEPPRPRPKASPARREHVLERALRAGWPIRADGRLLTVARSREDVVGVLLLIDLDGLAGKHETVALQHGATVLAMERCVSPARPAARIARSPTTASASTSCCRRCPTAAGVERFVRRWLGALLDYDARKGSELTRTLSRYLECGGSYDATAQALALRRSTRRDARETGGGSWSRAVASACSASARSAGNSR